ncbi:hypothetical protein NE236_10145 [Actinoallomurus purpureus]|uniref:hypothetical protein n=1 Tax=Actinoallomurus purpureus TaxID=478114 RepID=UPI002092D59B|nr:hypothetical protein [Actinoallomurus purpureus]MCO6005345.1 hypothetical protein [Actinoallomurus purpureus]
MTERNRPWRTSSRSGAAFCVQARAMHVRAVSGTRERPAEDGRRGGVGISALPTSSPVRDRVDAGKTSAKDDFFEEFDWLAAAIDSGWPQVEAPEPPRPADPPDPPAPLPPWYVRQGGFGDGGVSSMAEVVSESVPEGKPLDTTVDQWITGVTTGMKQATAAKVRARIIALLGEDDPRAWERLLRHGKLIVADGVRVKLTFSAEQLGYEPGEPAEPGYQTYFSKYGDTSYAEGESSHRRTAGGARIEPVLFVAAAAQGGLSHVSPSVKVGAEQGHSSGHSVAMEVQSGNRVIANATHLFTAKVRVAAAVNREAGRAVVLPGKARLAFPTVYSSAAEERPGDGGHPTLRVVEPSVLQGLDHAVNAAVPGDLLDALTETLENELGLPEKAVDEIRQEIAEEYLNEKTLKDRSQWWLTNSWVSGLITKKLSWLRSFSGHLEISAIPRTVRYVTTTEQEVLIRNDIADTAMFRDGGEHESSANIAPGLALGVEIGDHLATPGFDPLKISSEHGHGRTVAGGGQTKNAIMRKDRLVRYRTEFEMTVILRSDKGQAKVTRPVLGELAVGREHAKEFERRALGGKHTGSGLVMAPGEFEVPDGREPAPVLPPRQKAGFTQRLRDRFIRSDTTPAPFPSGGVRGVDDLLRLAGRGPIEIALPPALHDGRAPTGLRSEGRRALLGNPGVTWVFMGDEASSLVSRAEGPANASWRYVVDDEARVVGALFMEEQPTGVREPRGYVPNPAATAPPKDAEQQRPDAATEPTRETVTEPTREPVTETSDPVGELDRALRVAGLSGVADFVTGGGVPQVQLSDALRRRLDKAAASDPLARAVILMRTAPGIHVIGADGRPLAAEDPDDESAEERHDAGTPVVPPESRFVIDGVGSGHGPLRPWHHVPHPREPRALAARKGLGRGIVRETPGLEEVYREVRNALAHQMRAAGVENALTASERQHLARVLAMKFGVPGLRGAYAGLLDGGVAHEVQVGDYVFTVMLDAELRHLRREPVAETGVTLDAQRKGVTTMDVEEKRGVGLGAGFDIRFRAKLAHVFSMDINALKLGYKRSWAHKVIDSTGIKEYRRDRTAGNVTRFEYETAYKLAVTTRRASEGVVAAQVRELSGDAYWTAVTVSDAHLPDEPVSADELLEVGRVTVENGPLTDEGVQELAGGQGKEFDLSEKGLSGIQVGLIGVSEISTQLAAMVAQHNHLSWAGTKSDAFQEVLGKIVPSGGRYGVAERILRAGTQTFLEANARTTMRERGLVVPLPPTADGWQQEVRIRMRTFNARHDKTVKGGTLEQYTEADLRFGEENEVTDTLDAAAGLSGVGRIGGTPPQEGARTASQKSSSQISGGVIGSGGASWGRHDGDLGGGLDLNLGTYSGDGEMFGADPVYTLEYRRWRRRSRIPERPKDQNVLKKKRATPTPFSYTVTRHVRIDRGMEILAPYVRAADHGLPVPARDGVTVPAGDGLTVPARDDRPVVQGERGYLEKNLALAVAYVEDVDAGGVGDTIRRMLGERVDPELLRAVETAFSEEAVRAQYGIARRGGIRRIFTMPAKLWPDHGAWDHMKMSPRTSGTMHTGIRVTATEQSVEYERPRPDVKVTTGGQAFIQKGKARSRGRTGRVSGFVHGRWAGAPYGLRPAGGVSGAYESGGRSKVGTNSTARDIRRATAQDTSQEFTHTVTYNIEIFYRYSPDELTRKAGRLLSLAPELLEVLSRGESRRLWQRFFPADRPSAVTEQVPGRATVLVPTHLTTTASRASAAGPVAPPVTLAPAQGVARTTAPAPSALATALAEHVQALSVPGAERLPIWAPLAAVPWRRVDHEAVEQGVEPIVEEFAPGTQDGLTLDLALDERNLRANIAALLAGTYSIPLVNGDHLTVQLVPSRARWLGRGRYSALNFPEHAAEPDRVNETHRRSSGGIEFDLGHPAGHPLKKDAERPLLDPGVGADRDGTTVRVTKSSAGDFVESNRQRDGDFDYYVFDAEYHVTGPYGHRLRVATVDGLAGMLPATVVARLLAKDPDLPLERAPLDAEWAQDGTLPSGAAARIVENAGGAEAVRAAGTLRLWAPAEHPAAATVTAGRLAADAGVPVELLIRDADGSIDRHLVAAAGDETSDGVDAAGLKWTPSSYSAGGSSEGEGTFCVEVAVTQVMINARSQ